MITLAKKEFCTGCSACASACPKNCISMNADKAGFRFPSINKDLCIDCGLCEKSCPVINPISFDGKTIDAYAAYSQDESIRMQSSSGGLFTEIAQAVIQDGGIVVGAAYDNNFSVVHICVDNLTDLARLRGAKYAQSNLDGVFLKVKEMLKQGRPVLFSGTPCQVIGLKSYLGKDYDHLLTVDFVCHSVPSPLAWEKYVRFRADKDNNGALPSSINLRSKTTGWSQYRYSNLFEYANKESCVLKNGESPYMRLFVGGYISRESCDNCPSKGYERASDFTLGDFWGIWNIYPDFDDDKGISVLLVQSDKGKHFLNKIKDRLILKEVSLAEASRENPAMIKVFTPHSKRVEALELITTYGFSQYDKLFPTERQRFYRLKAFIKRVMKRNN